MPAGSADALCDLFGKRGCEFQADEIPVAPPDAAAYPVIENIKRELRQAIAVLIVVNIEQAA